MKIGQNPDLPTALTQQVGAAAKQPPKAAAPAPAAEEAVKTATTVATAGGTPVTFSGAARALDPAARSGADFDANKVKAVRAAIEKGTFTVDAGAIADKLLSNAQEIIAHSPKSH
ncbi:flagellar biosynthesis anti-sigma factor FlgM [Acidovorax sp. GBBC 3334]|uniref:flagellar biosynthesis anti-sigma factor FlgM n=1 Tax=unclassified Acidovorax TaxID=2684926 RepID=UPI0023021BF8|nr:MULTISPECIES: flagellar biosynthesis anti-sigma factor FlgM [unclassified Acidovorax]MDA8455936.1 flagellar biosynthesis anti-sigma factor FlgM [Acidovorax sp. GBBC 3334]MDA8523748.1 flagellar biosynthesis anti-sigma factor FlgM [Acidovorax sp. NCPPB 4044]